MRRGIAVLALIVIGCSPLPVLPRPATTKAPLSTPPPSVASSPVPSSTAVARPLATAACPVTMGNGVTPPGEAPSPDYYGAGHLIVVLWPDGVVYIPAANVDADGTMWMKFPWWRGEGVSGHLRIHGQERSTGAAIRSDFSHYGLTGFQASGIGFPGPGCYEVTGEA